jgi:hypothetical protein
MQPYHQKDALPWETSEVLMNAAIGTDWLQKQVEPPILVSELVGSASFHDFEAPLAQRPSTAALATPIGTDGHQ